MTICDAEAKNWRVPLHAGSSCGAVRVAGCYECRHLPWYVDNGLPEEEAAFYRGAKEYSYYMGDRPARQVRKLFAQQDALRSASPVQCDASFAEAQAEQGV